MCTIGVWNLIIKITLSYFLSYLIIILCWSESFKIGFEILKIQHCPRHSRIGRVSTSEFPQVVLLGNRTSRVGLLESGPSRVGLLGIRLSFRVWCLGEYYLLLTFSSELYNFTDKFHNIYHHYIVVTWTYHNWYGMQGGC